MRLGSVLLVFLVVLAVVGSAIVWSDSGGRTLVVFGSLACPACSALEEFLNSSGIDHVFIDLRYCGSLRHREIVEAVSVPPVIPVSVVVDEGGNPTAVVVGALLNRESWENILGVKGTTVLVSREGVREIQDSKVVEVVKDAVSKALIECHVYPATSGQAERAEVVLLSAVVGVVSIAVFLAWFVGLRRKHSNR